MELQHKNQDRIERRDWYILIGLIITGIGVRLFMWYWTKASFLGDMIHYVDVARSLGSGKVLEAIGPLAPPIYPLLIQAGYMIVQDYDIAARLISVVFGGMLIYPVFRMAHMIYGRQVATLAGCLVIAAGELLTYSLMGYAESTYLFLITMAFYKGVAAIKRQSNTDLFLSGIFFGLAFLTKGQAIVFIAMTVFWMAGVLLIEERKIGGRVIQGLFFLVIGYFIIISPYLFLLHEKTGQWTLNPKKEVLESATFQYNPGKTLVAMYSLQQDGSGHYYTIADVVYAGKEVASGAVNDKSARPESAVPITEYLQQLVIRLVKGFPVVAYRLFPPLIIFFLLGLIKRGWNLKLEGYILAIIGINILAASMYTWNPRYLSTLMPLLILVGAYGCVRGGSHLGILTSKMMSPDMGEWFGKEGKRWTIMLAVVLLLSGLVQLLLKMPDDSYIARIRHQKEVAEELREKFGTNLRIMSWGIGRSAIPYFMGVKQSQVRTIPMNSLDMVLQYAKQEGVGLLVFDTGEIGSGRFPGIIELLNNRGKWPGLDLAMVSPRGRHVIFVYKVI